MNNKVALILLSSGILASCGGGGGGGGEKTSTTSTPASTKSSSSSSSSSSISSKAASSAATSVAVLQGQFKDTNISGLKFVSGAQSGVTNNTGTFSYEQGKTVSFSIGGVVLGSTQGKALITPIDLIENGSSNHQAIQNMVRFLLMLDTDAYAQNGIQLSSALQTAATSWAQIDFTSANFAQNLTTIMSAASAADGGSHQLPDVASAQQHLEATHLCNYSGVYKGNFSGDNKDKLAFFVSALDGNVIGFSLAENATEATTLSNTTAIQHKQKVVFESGNTIDKSSYNGEFTSINDISGTWKKDTNSGNFSTSRVGGAANSVHRFSATFNGNDAGILSIDVDASNKVSGTLYNIETNESQSISGQLKGPWLTATTTDNNKLQGLLNHDAGTVNGTWVNSTKGTSGNFSGSGCQLNPAPITINGFDDWKIGFNTGSQQLIPASGTNPLVVMDGAAVAHVRLKVSPWGEMSFPIAGFDKTGEAEAIDLSSSSFIEITYKSNQSVNLQLRQYAIHGGTHNQITLPAAPELTTVKIPFSDFKGGLTPLDLTKVAKFNFALLSNNTNDGYAELIVKGFKIDKFN